MPSAPSAPPTRPHAADLAAIAASLSSLPGAAAASMLGPVGARFLAALADATTHESRAVEALSDRLSTACTTAQTSAAAYEDADDCAGGLVSGV